MARAQPAPDDPVITQLNADLMPLKASPSLPERRRITDRFATDINTLYRAKGIATRNLAIGLMSVLEGKELSEHALTPLTSALLKIADSAYACRADASDPANSPRFRAAIEQAYNALIALHVVVPNAQRIMRLMYQAADRIARPIIRPIPPG
jgi:hypothetical protein